MPRRHRRTLLSGRALCPPGPPLSPSARAACLEDLEGTLDLLARRCAGSPILQGRLGPRERQRLRGRWHGHVPALSLRLGPLLDKEPRAFSRLGLCGDDLLVTEHETRRLASLKALLDDLSDQVADALLRRRAALHGDVTRVLTAVEELTGGALSDPEEARRIRAAAAPALGLLGQRKEKIRSRRAAQAAQSVLDPRPAAAPVPHDGSLRARHPGAIHEVQGRPGQDRLEEAAHPLLGGAASPASFSPEGPAPLPPDHAPGRQVFRPALEAPRTPSQTESARAPAPVWAAPAPADAPRAAEETPAPRGPARRARAPAGPRGRPRQPGAPG